MARFGPELPNFSCQFLDRKTTDNLKDTLRRIETEIGEVLGDFPVGNILSSISSIIEPTKYNYLPDTVFSTFDAIAERYDTSVLGQYKKCLIIRLIGEIDSKIATLNLPQSVLAVYPETLGILVGDLLSVADQDYLANSDAIIRELRLTSTRSLPCGSRMVDNCAYLTKSIYRNNGKLNNLKCLWFVYARLGGLAPLYRTHIDSRFLKDFNETGWETSYLRIADLLRCNPKIRGVVGTTWYYDPQLDTISPWLGKLRRHHQENGAYLRRDGRGEIHTQRAIATSRTRRKLYEKGEYIPTCYTLIWARRDLLRWADTVIDKHDV